MEVPTWFTVNVIYNFLFLVIAVYVYSGWIIRRLLSFFVAIGKDNKLYKISSVSVTNEICVINAISSDS